MPDDVSRGFGWLRRNAARSEAISAPMMLNRFIVSLICGEDKIVATRRLQRDQKSFAERPRRYGGNKTTVLAKGSRTSRR